MEIFGVSVENLLLWGVFGIIAGIIIQAIDKGNVRGGLLGTMLLGIAGALIGGYLARTFLGIADRGFSLEGIVIAVIGGLLLSYLYRLLFKDRSNIKTTTTKM